MMDYTHPTGSATHRATIRCHFLSFAPQCSSVAPGRFAQGRPSFFERHAKRMGELMEAGVPRDVAGRMAYREMRGARQ